MGPRISTAQSDFFSRANATALPDIDIIPCSALVGPRVARDRSLWFRSGIFKLFSGRSNSLNQIGRRAGQVRSGTDRAGPADAGPALRSESESVVRRRRQAAVTGNAGNSDSAEMARAGSVSSVRPGRLQVEAFTVSVGPWP